jgi:chorismate mutase
MAATRERLEAVIRRQLTVAIAGATTADVGTTEAMNRATQRILREVDEYTHAELGLLTPAERRHILFEGTS